MNIFAHFEIWVYQVISPESAWYLYLRTSCIPSFFRVVKRGRDIRRNLLTLNLTNLRKSLNLSTTMKLTHKYTFNESSQYSPFIKWYIVFPIGIWTSGFLLPKPICYQLSNPGWIFMTVTNLCVWRQPRSVTNTTVSLFSSHSRTIIYFVLNAPKKPDPSQFSWFIYITMQPMQKSAHSISLCFLC